MTFNQTLRKVDIEYLNRAPHPHAPGHQLQYMKNLVKNETFNCTQKTLIKDDDSYFTVSGCKMSPYARFYLLNVHQTPRETNEYPTKSFESKMMI